MKTTGSLAKSLFQIYLSFNNRASESSSLLHMAHFILLVRTTPQPPDLSRSWFTSQGWVSLNKSVKKGCGKYGSVQKGAVKQERLLIRLCDNKGARQ